MSSPEDAARLVLDSISESLSVEPSKLARGTSGSRHATD